MDLRSGQGERKGNRLAAGAALPLPGITTGFQPSLAQVFGAQICIAPFETNRERIQSQLSRTPGEHLVIVHYQQRDVPSVEWVYNRADIDHAKVVWARDMGPEANQELLRYFASRRIWYVDRNSGSLLAPYTYTSVTGSCHPANGLPPACGTIAELPALR